ncbi:hypothetical protein DVS28_b0185 (plasmid) [Euzebya pacifica]|uniref:Uncharacterized protein n=1 Tax=Euzebya pacifica TaxID=1608957 RepID=A0A346Y658_9ACTN|nr:hypothetical protein [Euzebya pacifica]AXV09955.1 hypothetical protein DVS28_b0185 [Euzebya pacifica]
MSPGPRTDGDTGRVHTVPTGLDADVDSGTIRLVWADVRNHDLAWPPDRSPMTQRHKEALMGWWSTDLMGGDAPMDIHGWWTDKAGLDFDDLPYPGRALTTAQADAVAAVLPADLDAAKATLSRWETHGPDPVARHLLGIVWMQTGRPMPDDIKAHVVSLNDTDLAAWHGDPDREAALDAFADTVNAYTGGQRMEFTSKGLFAAINDLVTDGRPGLVNHPVDH